MFVHFVGPTGTSRAAKQACGHGWKGWTSLQFCMNPALQGIKGA